MILDQKAFFFLLFLGKWFWQAWKACFQFSLLLLLTASSKILLFLLCKGIEDPLLTEDISYCLHFPQAKVCAHVIFPGTPFQCDCSHSWCLCVVCIFLNVLCQNTPSTDVARARGRMILQPPCSAAQLHCILSLRGQRVPFQSHCGQIYTYPSTLSSYLVLSLPLSFRHSCLPQCPNYPQRDRRVRFVLFAFIS